MHSSCELCMCGVCYRYIVLSLALEVTRQCILVIVLPECHKARPRHLHLLDICITLDIKTPIPCIARDGRYVVVCCLHIIVCNTLL